MMARCVVLLASSARLGLTRPSDPTLSMWKACGYQGRLEPSQFIFFDPLCSARYKSRLEPSQVRNIMNSLSYLAPRGTAERQEFEQLMQKQCLPQYSTGNMADTVYALGKSGCTEPTFMDQLMNQALKAQRDAQQRRG
eukprot:gene10562-12215_t